jgi:hypothetical protein
MSRAALALSVAAFAGLALLTTSPPLPSRLWSQQTGLGSIFSDRTLGAGQWAQSRS